MKDRPENETVTMARIANIRSTLQETKSKPFDFKTTVVDFERRTGDGVYLNGRKAFHDLPKHIKKNRSVAEVEKFFEVIAENKNLDPRIVEYLRNYSHQNGFLQVSETYTLNYLMEKGRKIYGEKNRYDYIVNDDGTVTFVEQFYIDGYVNIADTFLAQIHPEDESRPLAIGFTISTIRLDQGEIKHELAYDKIILVDEKTAPQLFMKNRFLFWCRQKFWQLRGRKMKEFPYILFDDEDTVLHERYDASIEEIEAELAHDVMLARNNNPEMLKESFAKETWFDRLSMWVDRHPYLTALIVFLAVAVVAAAITTAIVFAPGAAVPALFALKVGKAVTLGAASGIVAKVLGILGIGTLMGMMASAGTLLGKALDRCYGYFFADTDSQTSNGDEGGCDDDEPLVPREPEVSAAEEKCIVKREVSDKVSSLNIAAGLFPEEDKNVHEETNIIHQNIYRKVI